MRSIETISHSQNALAALEREYRRTEAEIRSFTKFDAQVSEMDGRPPLTDGGGRRIAPLQRRHRTAFPSKCESVCRAYDNTVLSVPHYAAEYDESLEEHMAAELGQDVAINLFESREFPQQLKRALRDASQQAREQRDNLLARLDAETEDVKNARATLTDIVDSLRTFNSRPLDDYFAEELSEISRRLSEFETECERVATDRQTTIRSKNGSSVDEDSDQEYRAYLYRDLDTTYPILSDVAECCQLLEEARTNVERKILANGNRHEAT